MIKKKETKQWNRRLTGSLTVEASLLLPVFLFATLSVIYMNKFLLYQEQVQWALTRIGREASLEYAISEKCVIPDQLYLTAKAKLYLKDAGVTVSLLRSKFDEDDQELHLVADYQMSIPFPLICQKRFMFSQRSISRAFVGVETRGGTVEEKDEEIVYITRTGRVYHSNLSCAYLKLSVSQVKYGDLVHLRSASGGKYYACESCVEKQRFYDAEDVLICNFGNRFHQRRSCSKIKRSIQEVQRSEVGNRLPCSKCGGEEG